MNKLWARAAASICAAALASSAGAQTSSPAAFAAKDATRLSAFGARPAFSPDGKRLAFVGRTFGDAYEIDFETKSIRNLTSGFPHEGIVRIQYLPNGDYLVVAPRRHVDNTSRFDVELWVLDKDLKRGLQPLGQRNMEGVVVSRSGSKISWTEMSADFSRPRIENGRYVVPEPRRGSLIIMVGDLVYEGAVPKLINRREVLRRSLPGCVPESQDFFDGDTKLTLSCADAPKDEGVTAEVWAADVATGRVTVLHRDPKRYNEVEGIAPDESWTLVECGDRIPEPGRAPPLDLCRLELREGGAIRPLITTPRPSTAGATNGVVSPDGNWVAFQAADHRNETGVGEGIYLVRIAGDDPAPGRSPPRKPLTPR